MEKVASILQRRNKEALAFPFSYHQFQTEFLKACQSLNLQKRHSLSISTFWPQHRSSNERKALNECKSRGQWRTNHSVQRYEKSARLAAHYLALPRTTCRGSHSWNQPKLCSHWRLKRQNTCTSFLTAVASCSRAYGVPCYSMCKNQASLTLQRLYRVNLCHDIKYRRIAGSLLPVPRGTDSLSIRCLDPVCFLDRQLHVARKPWIIVSSSSSNIW